MDRTILADFNDLRFFAAVVSHGGFSAAARVLGLPKSRLSRRVALLEAQLGIRLLERSTRRVMLTEVGLEVYDHARAAVIEAEAVDEIALRMRAEPRGLVRISCPPGFLRALERALPDFLAAHPLLRVQCIMSNRRMDLVEDGIDIAVRVREQLDTDASLQVRQIGTSAPILVASPGLVATLPPLATPADLLELPLLDQQEGRTGSWTLIGPDRASVTLLVTPRLATGSFELLLAAARNGIGIGLLPEPTCAEALAEGALVRIFPEWHGADGIVHLVFTSRRGMLPGVRAVIDFIASTLKPFVTN
jgi:DNA-binding transcriptional LysR family regulator